MWDTLLYLQYRILWSVAQLQRNQYSISFHAVSLHYKWTSKNITTTTTNKTPTPWCSCSPIPILAARLCGISSPHSLWPLEHLQEGLTEDSVAGFCQPKPNGKKKINSELFYFRSFYNILNSSLSKNNDISPPLRSLPDKHPLNNTLLHRACLLLVGCCVLSGQSPAV